MPVPVGAVIMAARGRPVPWAGMPAAAVTERETIGAGSLRRQRDKAGGQGDGQYGRAENTAERERHDTASLDCLCQKAGPQSWRIYDCRLRSAEPDGKLVRSEEHTSELQSLMRTSYAVFCSKK